MTTAESLRNWLGLTSRLALSGLLTTQIVFAGEPAAPEDLATLKSRMVRLREKSRWLEAMPLAEKLVTLTVDRNGEDTAETADAIHQWALLVQYNGDYEKAEELWLRALAIDEKLFGKGTLETTRRTHLLATLYREQGEYQKAEPLLKQSLSIREKKLGLKDPETAQIVRSLGKLYVLTGDFAAAEANLVRAYESFHSGGYVYWWAEAACSSDLARLYCEIGDFERAKRMTTRALALWREFQSEKNELLAQNLSELASIYLGQGEPDAAEGLLRESLAIRQSLLGTNHWVLARVLEDLGAVFMGKDDLEQAESVLKRSLTILKENLGLQHPQAGSVFMALSRVQERRGNYQPAKELCKRALDLREIHYGPTHYLTLASLRQLANLAAALGQRGEALAAADRIQDGEESFLANILSFTSERQRLAYQEESGLFWQRCDLWADLGAVEPLARSVLRTKGLVLDSLLEDQLLALASDQAQVRNLATQIANTRRRLARVLLPVMVQEAGRTNRLAQWEALSEEIESLESSLARHVAGVGGVRRALSVNLEHVQSAIPEQTVLLEMLRYRHYLGKRRWQEHYGILILSQKEKPAWVSLGPAEPIEKSIKLLAHAVRNPSATDDLADLLRELHSCLWAPVEGKLPANTKRIILSPDGELNFVSFATLLRPTGRFLGEEYLLSYVSCGRDLLVETKAPPTSADLLVWANPDFGVSVANVPAATRSACKRELRSLNFQPLPGAEREGRMLYNRAREFGFDRAVLHLGSTATEAALHRVSAPRTLHLATHGFVLPQTPEPDFQKHDYQDKRTEISLGAMLSPVLRSGLALAGAQCTVQLWAEGKASPAEDDGIVTAEEIGSLDLRGTWLVVLSGCDTGTGQARAGEGVLGLRRGFIQAGAQNLLLTLWPIDDEETANLMPDFYAEMQKSPNFSSALARVQGRWLGKLREERGVAEACRLAGPFILSFQGRLK